jgi:hypothetical protein
MSATWLTPEEVCELTARKRWQAQCRALTAMAVPYKPNAVGRPLVERSAVVSYCERPKRRPDSPDWSSLKTA